MPSGIRLKQPGPPPPTASCYICLESSTDSNNQPLLRNCACRGDAGWAHIACLAKFAASKITEAQRNQDFHAPILQYWTTCFLCKTNFVQNMGLAMASACVQQYEHLQDTSQFRAMSLEFMASATYDSRDYDAALGCYTKLLEICEKKTKAGCDMRQYEVKYLAQISQVFARKKRPNDAIAALEKELEIQTELHGSNSSEVRSTKPLLMALKKSMEGGSIQKIDGAEVLAMARQVFMDDRNASRMYRDNEDGSYKVDRTASYSNLIQALNSSGKYQEAMELSESMVSESRCVLGPDHPDTLKYKNYAEHYRWLMKPGGLLYRPAATEAVVVKTSQTENVWAVVDCVQKPSISGKRVKVLRAAKDVGKYICQIENHESVLTKFKALYNQLILEKGTKVVVHGLISSTDLNGSTGIICSFDKEKQRYAVETSKESTVLIKSINLNIAFCV